MLYIMRHGRTDWNERQKLQGRTDIPLNDEGRRMAEKAREEIRDIPLDFCYCSPLLRAYETARIVLAGRDIPVIRDGRLRLKEAEKPLTLTYHDPCMLGRLSETYVPWEGEIRPYGLHVPEKHWNRGENGVYDPPREVLKAERVRGPL